MCLSGVIPYLAGFRLHQLVIEDTHVILVVVPTRRTASCPICQNTSARIQSQYDRTLVDLPLGDRPVRLRLRVRRFRCGNRACPRRVFAERFPDLTSAYARRTHAQRRALEDYGFEAGGSGGARLAKRRGVIGSRATILRLVQAARAPEVATPRVLGVDDWARKRGQTYGTILIDLEQHRPVDLLEDRTAAGFAAWLKQHPGVEIIARDRGGAYADGGRQGAPAAIQVADRFHVLRNSGEALERVLGRKRVLLKDAAAAVDQSTTPPPLQARSGSAPAPISSTAPRRPSTRDEEEKALHRAQRRERYETVIALYQQGFSVSQIAREVRIGRKTVRRFLQAGSFPERASSPRRSSILDPFEPYLRERWAEGCHNSLQLWRDLQPRGFTGAASLLRRFVARWRPEPGTSGPPPRRARAKNAAPPPLAPTRALSPREARWLLLHHEDELRPDEETYRAHLLQADGEIQAAQVLAVDFGQLVRQRQRDGLDPWLARAEESGVPEFQEFARVMRRDQAAVEAALTYEWSNGQTEGQITRVKYLKRQMYGRASFRLLKKRVLHAA